jgi:hypothetical protein
MVGISIQCRLGNQLFQYAFIRSITQKFKTSFFVSETIEEFAIAKYFDLKGYNPRVNKLKWLLFKIKTGNLLTSLQTVSIDRYDQATDNKIYNGYFQSEQYFENIAGEISTHVKIKQQYVDEFNTKYQDMFNNNLVVAVHIRRGDYLDLDDWWAENLGSHNLTLPIDYYLNCLKQVANADNCKFFFVSDDMEFTRSAFAHVKGAEFAQNSMIIDFQILMNADECIIANSSFAWWAAYLNKKETKKIYCPQYWLGFKVQKEYPANIIPQNWIKVKV